MNLYSVTNTLAKAALIQRMSLAVSSTWGEAGRRLRFREGRTNFPRKTAWRAKYGDIHIYMVEMNLEFEWDLFKDAANLKKHGCSFLEAVETFKDPKGLQLVDRKHSLSEPRRYWVGRATTGKVLTPWFTLRGS